MVYIGFSFKKLYNYVKHKNEIIGFYVTDTKLKSTEICRLHPFIAFEYWLWYLGVPPKYAFIDLQIKSWIKKIKDRCHS